MSFDLFEYKLVRPERFEPANTPLQLFDNKDFLEKPKFRGRWVAGPTAIFSLSSLNLSNQLLGILPNLCAFEQ